MNRWLVVLGLPILLLGSSLEAADGSIVATDDPNSGQIEFRQGDLPVLRYNYRTVDPPTGYIEKVGANNRKYARARSNYIHPLYGLDGRALTKDWSIDHPHHRGIYWAWPEVQYDDQLGDLHALQRVFARPTGRFQLRHGPDFAEVEAENEWRWEDKTPIVRETTTIRAHKAVGNDRYIDLRFEFTALTDSVTLARRGTSAYGGLNVRLAPVDDVQLSHYSDSPDATPRVAWQSAFGTWQGSDAPESLTVLEHSDNPDYPGDYVQYPNLPWFQPTFPRAGTRFQLAQDKPLVLKYRLWIHLGTPASDTDNRNRWHAFQASMSPDTHE